MSRHQKYRQRERLRHVDSVIETLDNALARKGQTMKKVERWKMEMPTEQEMLPKDKYSVFDRKVKRYRKGIHSTCSVDGIGLRIDAWNEQQLMRSRGTEVDESQSETQSPGFLEDYSGSGFVGVKCILSVMIPLHQMRRNMDEYSHLQV